MPGTSGFTAAAMRATLKSFVEGPTLVLHHAVPLLEKAVAVRGGTASVVNITSVVSQRHAAALPVYSAAKAAADSLTKSAAASLGPKGIRVNAVAPGPVFTDALIANGLTQEQSDAFFNDFGAKTPLGRAGQPQEIANVVSFAAVDRGGMECVCLTCSTVGRQWVAWPFCTASRQPVFETWPEASLTLSSAALRLLLVAGDLPVQPREERVDHGRSERCRRGCAGQPRVDFGTCTPLTPL